MKVIGGAGLACLGAGLALSPVVPVVMKLWTVSYGLMSAGWACLIFLFLYWLIDMRGYKRWTFPLVVIGTNAIAAYLGPGIVPVRRIAGIFTNPIAQQIGAFGPLLSTGVALLVTWLVLAWMYKRKIFLRP
jgi:predicted acyltransferase